MDGIPVLPGVLQGGGAWSCAGGARDVAVKSPNFADSTNKISKISSHSHYLDLAGSQYHPEASQRSTVRVRLDGHSGHHGNYFKATCS